MLGRKGRTGTFQIIRMSEVWGNGRPCIEKGKKFNMVTMVADHGMEQVVRDKTQVRS